MPRNSFQTNFSAGELDPRLYSRVDTEQYASGAKGLRNTVGFLGGGTAQRPGLRRLGKMQGDSNVVHFESDTTTRYWLVFSSGRMDAYTIPDGTAAGSLTGQPWTSGEWKTFDWEQTGETLIITHWTLGMYEIKRTGASTWSINAYSFREASGVRMQPYYRVADAGVTLTVSAYSGSGVTLTTSANHWQSGHVGNWIRYLGKSIEITGYTNETTATGTIKQALPPSQLITIPATADYIVGQLVEGGTSGAKGVVREITSGTQIKVAITEGRTRFTSSEEIIGPTAVQTSSAAADESSPLPVEDWDEEILCDLWGWPNAVTIHANRLMLANHQTLPGALIGSRVGAFDDFDVGDAADSDGLFEIMGEAPAKRIKGVISQEQLLIMTDRGPFYVPQTAANPFRPSSIAFSKFGGNWDLTGRLGEYDRGVIAVGGNQVYKLTPTGDQLKMWAEEEVSVASAHLVNAPFYTAFAEPIGSGPERYGIFVNTDGSVAAMLLMQQENVRQFRPWDTAGTFMSVAASRGDIAFIVKRTINGADEYWLETPEEDLYLDGATAYATIPTLADGVYANTEVDAMGGRFYLGKLTAAADGTVTMDDPSGSSFEIGFAFTTEVETLPPIMEDSSGSAQGDLARIIKAQIHVRSSLRLAANGYAISAYHAGEDWEAEPPLRSGPLEFWFLGWIREPTIKITQEQPGPLEVSAIQTEVVW